tara:strand:- start:349 stop:525 length:177 start_codon:yes stop_codon:yes gene_type:complete
MAKKITLVDQIEEVRRKNNKNWMDLLRIALKNAPKDSRKILQKINKNDKKISKLFSKF